MSFFALLITWINIPVNALSRFLLAPVGLVPGWLSNTIISALVGVVLLIVFKYISNQNAIGHARDDVKANLLALKLFKDNISVTFQAQLSLFMGAMRLLLYAIRPMLVMILPVSLLLGQLGLWYQHRPLQIGEEATVTMKLNGRVNSPWPEVTMNPMPAAKILANKIRILSKRELYWKIKARKAGYHRIVFQVDGKHLEKELVIGKGLMRVSTRRPGWSFEDILVHPWEKPFGPDTVVQSISIQYPERSSWTSGTDTWLIYFFISSLLSALIFKPFLKVRI